MFKRRKEADLGDAARDEQLQRFLDDAETFYGLDSGSVPGLRIHVIGEERIFLCVLRASLIEMQTSVAELRDPVPVDEGQFVVTTTRAIFMGARQVRRWGWDQLASVEHADAGPWTSIGVSNRQREFGVRYDDAHRDEIRFSIDLAIANAHGTRPDLVRQLAEELTEFRAERSLRAT